MTLIMKPIGWLVSLQHTRGAHIRNSLLFGLIAIQIRLQKKKKKREKRKERWRGKRGEKGETRGGRRRRRGNRR